jgi:hypothetical protein
MVQLKLSVIAWASTALNWRPARALCDLLGIDGAGLCSIASAL